MAQDIYHRIGKNSLYNLLLRFFSFPLWLILPPIILIHIGVEGYGIWAFIQVFVNYSGFLNTGIDAIVKYTAEYKARGNYSKIIEIFNTFFVLNLFLFALFFLAVFICRDRIIDIFMKTDKIPREDISFVLILYAATFAIKNIYKVYPSFLTGLERMDLTNKVEMLSAISYFIFSIAFLYLGWGIKGLAVASALSALIIVFIYFLVCSRVTPYLRLNPFLFNPGIFSETYKFISYGIVGGIASATFSQTSKLIVSYFLGLRYLTYYDLGHRLASAVFGSFCSFITPIMPAASGAYASFGVEKLKEVFQTTFKYLTLISTPVFLFISVFAEWIIFIWLGSGYEEAAFVLRFLSLAYLIMLLTGPGASILTGMGLVEIPFYGSILTAATNVILSLIMVTKFGLTGIIISDLAAYILGSIYGLYYLQKELGSPFRIIFRYMRFPLLTSMGILLILNLVRYAGNHYIELVSSAILFSIVYTAFIYRNPEYERVREFIRHPFFFLRYRG